MVTLRVKQGEEQNKESYLERDAKKPLSDQKIADILKDDGVNIARRTVAKYREAMNICPSSRRKRLY